MTEFLNNGGYMYIAIIGGITVLGILATIFNASRQKKAKENFLKANPDAVKVFLTSKAFITQEAVQIHLVNGGHPILFTEKGKSGFYLLPGDNNVTISYTYTRPGVMYKNVTKTTGAVEKELTIEENKNYILSFDRKKEEFTFEETENA